MSIAINIEQKPLTKYTEKIKIKGANDVYNLKEVQEIKSAIQEYMLFIGLDRANYIRDVDVVGIGKSNCIYFDVKDIIRKAINTASSKVILVHNHPSNSLKPSSHDEEVTMRIEKLLKTFDIQLVDHIIVNDIKCSSILDKEDSNMCEASIQELLLSESSLIQENFELKKKIEILEHQLRENNNEEEEFSI